MKIKYENVGSIINSEVEYLPGNLTLIRGETGQGKSLMFYGLADGLLNNGSDFKRYLNNKALEKNPKAYEQITLTDDNNNEFKVKATSKNLEYYFNGEKSEKPQGKTIFEVLNKQIPGILFSPDEPTPLLNIIQENEGFFPINRTDSQIYKTYERLLSITSTQDIMRGLKLDIEDIEHQQKDKLQSIQKYQEQQTKISSALNSILDERKLDNILDNLIKQYNNYIRVVTLYNSVIKDINYINAYNKYQIPEFKCLDLNRINSAFISYTQATKIINYENILNNIEIKELGVFKLEKAQKLNNSYNLAFNISNEIDSLNTLISQDIKALRDIELILKEIKICPLCGKPMEE